MLSKLSRITIELQYKNIKILQLLYIFFIYIIQYILYNIIYNIIYIFLFILNIYYYIFIHDVSDNRCNTSREQVVWIA